MRKKSLNTLIAFIILVISFSYSNASATTVTLDGVANSGWWADTLTSSYLYVKDSTTDSYTYQWRYGVDPDPLPWSNIGELTTYLNTQGYSWWLESGGDPFNATAAPIWTSIYLEKGLYNISLTGDSSAYNLSSYWGGDDWNAYVQMYAAYGDGFNFGEGSYISDSANNALDYYRTNVDGMTISLKENTNLYFYINDTNSIDNAGSVKFDISVVPEPRQVMLFISGGIPLVFWRQRKEVWLALKQAVRKT